MSPIQVRLARHRRRSPLPRRRFAASLTAVAALVSVGLVAPLSASADEGATSFGMSMVPDSGRLMIAGNEPGLRLADATSLNGDFNATTGAISGATLSSAEVTFIQHVTSPVVMDITINQQLIQLDPGSATGTLDADGNMTLNAAFKLHVKLTSQLANGDCYSQPINIALKSTSPYDATTGKVTLRDAGFTIPNLSVSPSCAALIVNNAGAQFAGSNNRLELTLDGNLGTPLTASSTSLAISPTSPVMRGEASTLTATVTPEGATGEVNFLSGDTVVGSAPVTDGVATLTKALGTGNHQIRAQYTGDEAHAGSKSAAAEYVVRPYAQVGGDLPAILRPGAAAKAFTLSVKNPEGGRDESNVRVDFAFGGGYLAPDQLILETKDGAGNWQPVPLTGTAETELTGSFGPTTGFALPAGTTKAVPMRIALAAGSPAVGLLMNVTATLRQVDGTTGDAGATLDSANSTVIIPVTDRVAVGDIYIDTYLSEAKFAQGYPISWYVNIAAPYDENNATFLPDPDGRAELLVDGKPFASSTDGEPRVTHDVMTGYLDQYAAAKIETTGLAPGLHTVQVRYLGGTTYLPKLSDPVTFEILPAFGKIYDCSSVVLGNTYVAPVMISALGDLPSLVPAGKEIPVENVAVTIGASPQSSWSASKNLEVTFGPAGTMSIPTSVNEPAGTGGHADNRLQWTGGNATTTVTGQPGDRVDLTLERVKFTSAGFFGDTVSDCVPAGQAASAAGTRIAGISLSVSPDGGSGVGDDVVLTATVSPTPAYGVTSKATFYDGGHAIGMSDLQGGVAEFTTANLAPGSHTLTVGWSGSLGIPETLSAPVVHTVQYDTRTTISSPSPQVVSGPVTVNATVATNPVTAIVPNGAVQFKVDGSNLGTPVPLTNGTASLTTSAMSGGSHVVTAFFVGNDAYAASTSAALNVTVGKTTTTLAAAPATTTTKGLMVTITNMKATLTGPSGPIAGKTIVFKVGTGTPCKVVTNASGVATCTATVSSLQLLLGPSYTASFAGDATTTAATVKGGLNPA